MRTFTSLVLALGLGGSIVACDAVDDDPVLELRAQNPIACGGFAGLTCPGSMNCIDDPSDDCDPNNGGADCIGMCVGNPGNGGGPSGNANCHASDDPGTTYLANSPEECAVIHFICVEGYEPFFNDCGCGCAPVQ